MRRLWGRDEMIIVFFEIFSQSSKFVVDLECDPL